jgi:hypothetical protein
LVSHLPSNVSKERSFDHTLIHAAPAEDPQRPLSRAKYIAWLRNKGVEVAENSDGSMTMSKPRR